MEGWQEAYQEYKDSLEIDNQAKVIDGASTMLTPSPTPVFKHDEHDETNANPQIYYKHRCIQMDPKQ